MKRTHTRGGALPPAALLVVLLAPVAPSDSVQAQQPALAGGPVVASAAVHQNGVDIHPSVAHAGGVVTVSGRGIVFQRPIEAGGGAAIGVFDPAGQLLPDGVYRWEVELYPDAPTAAKLRAAARKNDGRAPGAWPRQSGTFAIRNGLVAAPDLVEAGPAPREASADRALPMTLAGPSAARGPALDDDLAVGSREGVEAAVRAALASRPEGAKAPREGAALERTDAAALALGHSLEPALARDHGAAASELPEKVFLFDDSENGAHGRDRSENKR